MSETNVAPAGSAPEGAAGPPAAGTAGAVEPSAAATLGGAAEPAAAAVPVGAAVAPAAQVPAAAVPLVPPAEPAAVPAPSAAAAAGVGGEPRETPAPRASRRPAAARAEPAFLTGPLVAASARALPFRRRSADPLYRPLRIFTTDPETSRLDGGIALVDVPYEPLKPGPRGAIFEVIDDDDDVDCGDTDTDTDTDAGGAETPAAAPAPARRPRPHGVALDARDVLITSGRCPSGSDSLFRQQMVYAVASLVYEAFRRALGRDLGWAFGETRLKLRPRGQAGLNACYDAAAGEIRFGYQRLDSGLGVGQDARPGVVYSSLSHDVIAHEVTHALVDGLRAKFRVATGPDVPAFHEAIADIVALLNRFKQREFVRAALKASRGRLLQSGALTGIARELGFVVNGRDTPLRWVSDTREKPLVYGSGNGPYERGSVLVNAVFDVFDTLLERKTAKYVRLATGGLGVLPQGELPHELAEIVTDEASKLAGQLLTMCLRAIDYCPPVDLELGEYLRAVVTADRDLVTDDPWGYREAWIQAFRRRRIYPSGIDNFGEDALLWMPPPRPVRSAKLAYSRLTFNGDPGRAPSLASLTAQAREVGRMVSDAGRCDCFGLLPADPAKGIEIPCVESVRTSRRVGPDGQIVFDLVAEVTQRRDIALDGGRTMPFFGGCTLIIGPDGVVRYSVHRASTPRPVPRPSRTTSATRAGGSGGPASSGSRRTSGCSASSTPPPPTSRRATEGRAVQPRAALCAPSSPPAASSRSPPSPTPPSRRAGTTTTSTCRSSTRSARSGRRTPSRTCASARSSPSRSTSRPCPRTPARACCSPPTTRWWATPRRRCARRTSRSPCGRTRRPSSTTRPARSASST